MASELQTDYLTGKTVYFLLRNSTGSIWNGAAFEAYATLNYATYDILATEQGTASGYYTANMPAVAAGVYYVVAKEQAGGAPAETDITVGTGRIEWDGAAVPLVASGQVYLASGQQVLVQSGRLSGHVIDLLSGRSFIASGINTVVPIASISGINAVVPVASLSGVVANSGLFVSVPIATISGTNAVVPIASISGTVANVLSGTVYPASGQVAPLPSTNEGTARSGTASTIQLATTAISGADHYAGQIVVLRGGTGTEQSRLVVSFNGDTKIAAVAPDWGIAPDGTSVYEVLPAGRVQVASGQLSGQQLTARTVSDKSGYTVGTNLDKSGYTAGLISGVNYFASGHNAVVPPATLSGVNATVPIATVSGINAVVPPATLSGVVANSGLFVSVPIATISGVQAVATATVQSGEVYLASGHFLFGSGQYRLASGQQVVAAVVSDKTGYTVSTVQDKSGYTVGSVLDKSGYTLSASGLDTITVEAGMNLRQAQSVMAAVLAGRLSGAGTTSIRLDGANASGTNRIAATVDASGNRTVVSLSLPA